jgi:hypothetical protein
MNLEYNKKNSPPSIRRNRTGFHTPFAIVPMISLIQLFDLERILKIGKIRDGKEIL